MHITLTQLKHLLAVVHAGGVSKAARRINLSQPALSRSVAALEHQTGTMLFEREGSSRKLSLAGASLVAHAEKIVREVEALEQTVRLWSEGVAGSTSFGMGPIPAAMFMSRLLAKMTRDYPMWRVNAHVGTGDMLYENLARGDLDFIVYRKDLLSPDRDISSIAIGAMPLSFFARRDHPLAERADVPYEDIAAFPIGRGRIPESFAHANSNPILRLPPALVCDDQNILKKVMLASDTIIVSAEALLRPELECGQAVNISSTCVEPIENPLHIIWLSERGLSHTAQCVAEEIRNFMELTSGCTTLLQQDGE